MQAKRKRVKRLGLKQYQELPWVAVVKNEHHYYNEADEEISPDEYLALMETNNVILIEYVSPEEIDWLGKEVQDE